MRRFSRCLSWFSLRTSAPIAPIVELQEGLRMGEMLRENIHVDFFFRRISIGQRGFRERHRVGDAQFG